MILLSFRTILLYYISFFEDLCINEKQSIKTNLAGYFPNDYGRHTCAKCTSDRCCV